MWGYAPRELTRCVLAAFEVTLASICCCCPFYGRTGAFAGPLGCPIGDESFNAVLMDEIREAE